MRTRHALKRGLSLLFGAALLAGSGPCPGCVDDDCGDPNAAWCEAGVAFTCFEPNENGAYALSREDCAALNLTCVTGVVAFNGREGRTSAWCLDAIPCSAEANYACVTGPIIDGGITEPELRRCVAVEETEWYQREAILRLTTPGLERVLTPTGDLCAPCEADCDCAEDQICEADGCVPGARDAPRCCPGSQETPCP
ncbi:hypothetical protein KKF91_11400 [Myxococcota bacterium]|nr:hypothetical protein [Myxococcota bacterium]MBU1431133.1 hypothetical protein [Myxococcota bacterium]MBU1899568.1 hypothetical protein [Myxococcota bacterium]